MTVYRPKKSRFYHYDFQFRGERFTGSTGSTTKAEANAAEARERKRVASGEKEKPKLTVDQAFGEWWRLVGQFEASKGTTKGQLAHLLRLLGKATMMHAVDFAHVERQFVARRRGEKARGREALISNASVNRELELARRVWIYTRDSGYDAPYDRWAKHKLPEPKERVRELSATEQAKLFAQLPDDLAAVVEFALLSGQRRNAVTTLLWSRVDLAGGRATVRTKGTGKRKDVDHTFPLTPRMAEIIRGRPKVGPFVFTYVCERPAPPRGDRPRRIKGERYPFSEEGWIRKWHRALSDAGIADFRFHDLRHTALSRVVRTTGNLKMAMKLANHTDIATTARYAHVLDSDLLAGMIATESRNSPEPLDRETSENGGILPHRRVG